jgi:hypothetical protein
MNDARSSSVTSAPKRPIIATMVRSARLYRADISVASIVLHESPVVAPSVAKSIRNTIVVFLLLKISNSESIDGAVG